MTGDITVDIDKKRWLVRLRRDVIAVREKWKQRVEQECFKYDVLNREERLETLKMLYYVRVGEGAASSFRLELKTEFQRLAARIDSAGELKKRDRNDLWLPAVIQAPDRIEFSTYWSRSLRKITRQDARGIIEKLGQGRVLLDGEYYVGRPSVSDYVLRVFSQEGTESIRMNTPTWAVCLLSDHEVVPKLAFRKVNPKSMQRRKALVEKNFEVIVSQGGTTLYYIPDDEAW